MEKILHSYILRAEHIPLGCLLLRGFLIYGNKMYQNDASDSKQSYSAHLLIINKASIRPPSIQSRTAMNPTILMPDTSLPQSPSPDTQRMGFFQKTPVRMFLLSIGMFVAASIQAAHVEVANDLDAPRPNETVEVKLASHGPVVVRDAKGNEILSQMLDDNTVIFQAAFAPKEIRTFSVTPGDSSLPKPAVRTFARFVPERADDFAWENDRIAFRMYGPALQKTEGNKTGSGVDVWCKHVREPVINSMYKRGHYHNDDGKAADNYRAGSNRGCGGDAIWSDGKLWPSRCYVTWKLIAEGPIRTVFELTYAPWDANGRQVSEVKRVSLDLGMNLNRFECRYDTGNQPVTVAAGLFIHSPASVLTREDNWTSLWEKFSEGDGPGFIPVGLVWPSGSGGQFKQAENHALVLVDLKPCQPFVYYAGAGWSKGPDFPDAASWNTYLKAFASRLDSPLRVKISN